MVNVFLFALVWISLTASGFLLLIQNSLSFWAILVPWVLFTVGAASFGIALVLLLDELEQRRRK
jgi:hypothetical protein